MCLRQALTEDNNRSVRNALRAPWSMSEFLLRWCGVGVGCKWREEDLCLEVPAAEVGLQKALGFVAFATFCLIFERH